jgi:hypothetical protein
MPHRLRHLDSMVHTQPSSLLCSVDSAKFFAAEMILAVEYMHAKRPAPPHPFMCTRTLT